MIKIIIILLTIIVVSTDLLSKTLHSEPPQIDKKLSTDIQAFIKEIEESDYYKNLLELKSFVKNRTVISSKTGSSGFILYLDNDTWVAAFRDNKIIGHAMGTKKDKTKALQFIQSNKYVNATEPVLENIPYANNICNIPYEVSKSHGKILSSLAVGKNSFNFAFEDGHELDFKLLHNKYGQPAIRVFWEQW